MEKQSCLESLRAEYERLGRPLENRGFDGPSAFQQVQRLLSEKGRKGGKGGKPGKGTGSTCPYCGAPTVVEESVAPPNPKPAPVNHPNVSSYGAPLPGTHGGGAEASFAWPDDDALNVELDAPDDEGEEDDEEEAAELEEEED